MTEEIERLTVERSSADAIKAVAVQQGMITLRDDGLQKALMGITSFGRGREGGEVVMSSMAPNRSPISRFRSPNCSGGCWR